MKYILLCILLSLSIPTYAEIVTVGGVTCDIQRDKYGKIRRSKKVLSQFRKTVACPGTGKFGKRCAGFILDHKIPLCGCGRDSVDNIQWQSIKDAKAKDKLERKLCRNKGD